MENAFIVGTVIAVVQLISLVEEKKFWSAAKIVAAGLVGAIAGVLQVQGINVTDGIVLGLSASGLITSLKTVAGTLTTTKAK